MLWQEDEGWFYELINMDEPPEQFGRFANIVALWRSKWRGNAFPAWSSFELEELRDWWGRLFIYDLEGDEMETIRIRLWGTEVASMSGFDLTGQTVVADDEKASKDTRYHSTIDLEFCREIARRGNLGHACGPMIDGRTEEILTYHIMGMPLSREGRKFDQVLYAGFNVEQDSSSVYLFSADAEIT